ncbi:hypothetical protein K8I61_10565 [bacterium]|nr:hypothetical protein [bacterium]
MNKKASLLVSILVVAALVVFIGLIVRDRLAPKFDKNNDGNPDEWFQYRLSGELVHFKKDRNYDGNIDYEEYYVAGVLRETLTDTDNDGAWNIRGEYDEQGRLAVVYRDMDVDGRYERRIVRDVEADRPLYTEIDRTGSGSWERATAEDFPPQKP